MQNILIRTLRFVLGVSEVIRDKSTSTVTRNNAEIVRLYQDGNAWCALLGKDIMSGKVGFGSTKSAALRQLAQDIELLNSSKSDRYGR